ncbi:MAG: Fic/DOC family protein [Mycoplasmatales bacterium]
MKGYVLENKLGISTSSELHKVEEKLTKLKAIELWENNMLKEIEPFKVDTLLYIHRFLFQDIYDFAGQIRNVDISKGDTQFCLLRHMQHMINMINNMEHNTVEDTIDIYIELNLLHPFREGNGRATRIWLDNALSKKANVVVDWSQINEFEYMQAMIKSSLNDKPIKDLITKSLTSAITDKELFFRGLDKSYEYEELREYSSYQLFNEYSKKGKYK